MDLALTCAARREPRMALPSKPAYPPASEAGVAFWAERDAMDVETTSNKHVP
jgi:hypothetical protein